MSVHKPPHTIIPNVIFEIGLSPMAVFFYCYLCMKIGQKDGIHISMYQLSKDTGISENCLKKARKQLASFNKFTDQPLISTKNEYAEDGGMLPTWYELNEFSYVEV